VTPRDGCAFATELRTRPKVYECGSVTHETRVGRRNCARRRQTGSLGRALAAPQGALDHVALPKLDPDDPPITQTRALTRVEPGPQITPFECLNDLLDEPLVVQRRKQQGTLPRLERETSALPWGLVVHRIHRLALLMGDMFDGNLGANSTEDAGPKATDF